MADMKASVILELVDRVTAPARRISASFRGISRDAALTRLASDVRNVGVQFGRVSTEAGVVARRIRGIGLAAGAAALGTGGIAGFTGRYAAMAEEIGNSARKIGIGVEELQELRKVGDQAGVPVESLDVNMEQFVKRIGQAREGTGAAKKTFKAMGIELKDSSGKVKSAGTLMEEVADKISKIPDASKRAKLLNELFGRSGLELLPILEKGAAGIREMRSEVRGGVFTQEEINRLEEYDQNLDRMRLAFSGVLKVVVVELVPAMNRLVQRITAFAKANKEAFSSEIVGGLKLFGNAISSTARIINGLIRATIGWKVAIALLALTMTGRLVVAIARLIISFKFLGSAMLYAIVLARTTDWMGLVRTLAILSRGALVAAASFIRLGFAMMMNPIGLIIAGLAALAAAAYLVVRNWDSISMAIGDAADYLTQKWRTFTDWLIGRLRAIRELIPDFMVSGVKFGASAASTVLGAPMRAGNAIGAAISGRNEKTEVGGVLKIQIDSSGRLRVAEVSKRGGMDLDVDTGVMAVGY